MRRRPTIAVTVFVLAVGMAGCYWPQPLSEEYQVNNAVIEACERTGQVDVTGNPETDILGAWYQSGGGIGEEHELSHYPETAERLWVFFEGGNGHVWWSDNAPAGATGGNQPFDWQIDGTNLVIDDLPPAVLTFGKTSVALRTLEGADLNTGVLAWLPCDPDLPDGF